MPRVRLIPLASDPGATARFGRELFSAGPGFRREFVSAGPGVGRGLFSAGPGFRREFVSAGPGHLAGP
jgi:hypothetical protein